MPASRRRRDGAEPVGDSVQDAAGAGDDDRRRHAASNGLPRQILEFELTETVLMDRRASTTTSCCGYAREAFASRSTISAPAIRRSTISASIPVDRIKIAQVFIADLPAEPRRRRHREGCDRAGARARHPESSPKASRPRSSCTCCSSGGAAKCRVIISPSRFRPKMSPPCCGRAKSGRRRRSMSSPRGDDEARSEFRLHAGAADETLTCRSRTRRRQQHGTASFPASCSPSPKISTTRPKRSTR